MHVKILALSSALLAAGCVSAVPDGADSGGCPYKKTAPAEEAVASADEEAAEARDPAMFAARAGGTSLTLVRVDGKYISGPGVSLGRYDEEDGRALRGLVGAAVVDLRIEEGRVSGAIDNQPVDLKVERKGTSLEVSGLIPGQVSRFRVDEEGMKGLIGGCSYDLVRAGAGFTGRRRCGGSMQNFTLELPDTMASWSDADIAAVFAIFLR
jgi:hypothetical protein